MRLLKNNFGFTLIEVLIVCGILSVLSLGMMTMLDSTNRSVKTVKSANEEALLKSRMIHLLSDPQRCALSIDAIKNAIRTQPAGSHAISNLKNNDNSISEVNTTTPLDGGLRITSLNVGNGTVQPVTGGSVFTGFLTANLRRANGTLSSAKPLRVQLVAEYDALNELQRCSSAQEGIGEIAIACANLGGVYSIAGCQFGGLRLDEALRGLNYRICATEYNLALVNGSEPSPSCSEFLVEGSDSRSFTSNSTWTVPDNIKGSEITITRMIGGGGAGGSGGHLFLNSQGGRGGGAGALVSNVKIPVTLGSTCTINVGNGGTRVVGAGHISDSGTGGDGNDGAPTTVNCNGGGTATANGGAGGAAKGIQNTGVGGNGSGTVFGFGGTGGTPTLSGSSAPGTSYGAGGGGGGGVNLAECCNFGNGGNGARGTVEISWETIELLPPP